MGVATWKPSLGQQIAELRREQKMRSQVFPKLLASGKLSRKDADYRNACLSAAIATLAALEARSEDSP